MFSFPIIPPDLSIKVDQFPSTNLTTFIFCSVYIFYLAKNPTRTSLHPHGNCLDCCPYDEEWEIRYYLYNIYTQGQLLNATSSTLNNTGFRKDWPTVFLVHGWCGGYDVLDVRAIKNAYLSSNQEINIIIVDWGAMASLLFYSEAADNTRTVGKSLANFITKHSNSEEMEISSIHLIGFSLGAQVVGYAGKNLKETGITLKRITGIDPANPEFTYLDCNDRLCSTDAEFVDVVHVDKNIFGLANPIGDLDFYVNGAIDPQPDCGRLRFNTIGKYIGTLTLPCSHYTGVIYYAITVKQPYAFPVDRSNNSFQSLFEEIYMGPLAVNYAKFNGSYYVPARLEKSPWDIMFGEDV